MKIFKFFVLGLLFLLTGCAGPQGPAPVVMMPPVPPKKQGVYHKVKSGETLWRISKTYNVSMEEIVRSNNIPNVASIEKNQLIFIPGVQSIQEVILDKNDLRKDEFEWPLRGKILHYFGDQRKEHLNHGIDIQSTEGESVLAAREGRVVFADYLSGYGQMVIVHHDDEYHSVYAQNASLLVKLDDWVTKGQPLAKAGKKGDLAYVHFEIRRNAVAENPLFYLP